MSPSKNKAKILLVEDEKIIAKAYQIGFEHAGFSVVNAYDGEDGLEKARAERPDIILLDLIMPKMDGITMLEKMRKEEWGKDLPVLILTNSNDLKRHERADELKISDFLLKSEWSLGLLIKRVKETLKIK